MKKEIPHQQIGQIEVAFKAESCNTINTVQKIYIGKKYSALKIVQTSKFD